LNRHFLSLVSLVTALLLLVTLLPSGVARAADPLPEAEAIELLQSYNIVRGDPDAGLDLEGKLTRAQAAALFIRVLGQDLSSASLAGAVPYFDAQGHWAAGDITLASRMGLMRGDGNNMFRPQSEITYAEVLTVLLRILGREPEGAWERSKIMAEAAKYDLVPSGVSATAPALRGRLFWSLASAISRVPLSSGETVLKKHLDNIPPTLTVASVPSSTSSEKLEITGSAAGAAFVTVGGRPAKLDRKTSIFTYSATLTVGSNELKIEATDWAGNVASTTVTVDREGQVNRIEIEGPEAVRTGSSTKLQVAAYDQANARLPLDNLEVDLSGDVATFDVSDLTLKAGDKTGRGTLTLSAGRVKKSYTFYVRGPAPEAETLVIQPVNSGVAPLTGKEYSVKVQVVGGNSRVLSEDYFRSITLRSEDDDVKITESRVNTEAGVATFTVRSSKNVETTLRATSSGLPDAEQQVQFLPSPRIVLTSSAKTLAPDGSASTTIRAVLQDESGKSVTNKTSDDLVIKISTTGTDGELTDSTLTIRRNASSSSGDDATFKAGIRPGTARIIGTLVDGEGFSIQALYLPVTGTLPGATLQISLPSGTKTPGGAEVPVTVKVLDSRGRTLTTGSYAFQITVTTSNDEEPAPTLPEGVEFAFADSEYYPVDDGRPANSSLNDENSIVGRTYQGTATLYLKYDKSGTVKLTPKVLGPTESAYHPKTGFADASGSSEMQTVGAQVTFVAAAAGIRLTVDSALGKDLAGGAMTTARGSMTIRARVVDANGFAIPGYSGTATLTRSSTGDNVTQFSGTTADSMRDSVANGLAEWKVQTTGNVGYDEYTVSLGSLPSAKVVVAVRDEKLSAPSIAAIRGSSADDPSPEIGYISPNADFMDIQLNYQDLPQEEPSYWVNASVYRKGESSPFYTGALVNLKADPPIVRVPKAKLRAGRASYQVTINNGAGESAKSPESEFGLSEAVNATYNDDYRLTSGLFDAQTGKLVLSTSRLPSGGSVVLDKITIMKDNHRISLHDVEATVAVGTSSITLSGTTLPTLLDPDIFHGTVSLQAEEGWFKSGDGAQIAPKNTGAHLTPMPVITHASFDPSARRLYLHGAGLKQGTISAAKIGVGSVALRQGSGSGNDVVSDITDSQVTISLSTVTNDAIKSLPTQELFVTAEVGWLRIGSGSNTYNALPIAGEEHALYLRARVSSAEYDRSTNTLTIHGSGFADMTINPENLLLRASGADTDRKLSGESNVTVTGNTTITIRLNNTDSSFFESASGFSGENVFLNTEGGWATDSAGRQLAPIPQNSILFRVPRP